MLIRAVATRPGGRRGLATGSMHRYLAYMLAALIAVLARRGDPMTWLVAIGQAIAVSVAAPYLAGLMRQSARAWRAAAGGRR